uniref:Uncharacterized protein n=1 Tax=Strigamia maritima TaxID=126957 RepID=T1J3Y7_STRMM
MKEPFRLRILENLQFLPPSADLLKGRSKKFRAFVSEKLEQKKASSVCGIPSLQGSAIDYLARDLIGMHLMYEDNFISRLREIIP